MWTWPLNCAKEVELEELLAEKASDFSGAPLPRLSLYLLCCLGGLAEEHRAAGVSKSPVFECTAFSKAGVKLQLHSLYKHV